MRQVSAENKKEWRKLLPFAVMLAALFYSASQLFRMLWFDEVLTVNLLTQLPLSRIYFAYEIPNNHIVFTLLEKIWYMTISKMMPFPYFMFRLIPLASAGAAAYLLCRKLIRSSGILAGTTVFLFFVCSAVWAHYATAVRGYMLGFLLTVLALYSMERLLKQGKLHYLWYFLISLLSLGTAPTNLAALAGVSLYYLPYAIRNRKIRCWGYSVLAPMAALVLFYLPILPKFIGCMKLGEGWWSRANAVWVFYTGISFPIAFLLLPALGGTVIFFKKYKSMRVQIFCVFLTFLLPVISFYILKVPPFPRVFFPLCPILLCYAASGFNIWIKWSGRRKLLWILPLLLQCVITLFFFQDRAIIAADRLYGQGGRGDDYIMPYYCRPDFEPNKVMLYLNEKYKSGERFHIFASFDSDAPSLVFAVNLMDFPEDVLLVDTLNKPKTLRFQDYPGLKYLIVSDANDLQRVLDRFGFHSAVLEKKFGMQNIYRIIR